MEAQVATLDGERSEFALGICHVKAACLAAGVENGKQVARTWSAGNSLGSSDPNVVAQSIDAMHAAIRAFSETDFVSYLRLGELSLADLRQLYSEEEEHVLDGGVGGTALTQPRRD
ncbi:unnamed protein product [Lactuca virosa]|uniref:Uncharacterized protein n=1 Tax=Lactuca virosa TaxID=75947 RepID=A0AAU9MQJ1_9ASTR|nr:unnamed protein product [Lactuca virosa]